jgi:hypothetical protein
MKRYVIICSILVFHFSYCHAQLTIDRKELILSGTLGSHFQNGKEAPIGGKGNSWIDFRDQPGSFYRFGLNIDYVIKGTQQIYTENKSGTHSIRIGIDHSFTKKYYTNWNEIVPFQDSKPISATCKFWDVYIGYIIKHSKRKFYWGYGFNLIAYQFKCRTLLLYHNERDLYQGWQFGPSPLLLTGITLKQWAFELDGEMQWLWNRDVLGDKNVINEPPFFERLKTYSNLYAMARLSVGYRINLNKR